MKLIERFPRLRTYENLHILLWLVKDSCWMLHVRLLGTIMIVPTVAVALWIVWMTRSTKDLYINLSVLFWICANSAWMLMEFFYKEEYKLYTAIPFALGFLFVFVYYFKAWREESPPLS
ncbi:MAG TPA: hypothetical protein PLQ93_05380 [Bacteroidia bacterium]|nr:hypothetical protein [Bacteroidia bacterium]